VKISYDKGLNLCSDKDYSTSQFLMNLVTVTFIFGMLSQMLCTRLDVTITKTYETKSPNNDSWVNDFPGVGAVFAHPGL